MEEILSFAPSGQGPHWLLRVEKRGANTRWVAGELARHAGIAASEVGFAGIKDRHALARQWFSVPAGRRDAAAWQSVAGEGYRVLEVCGNDRKLRRGALRGNRFRIALRGADWPRAALEERLAAIAAGGVPNYFGPQRFGRQGSNLTAAQAWAREGVAPRERSVRGFALSAARAALFNAVLARRVGEGSWSSLATGDLVMLQGTNSHFPVDAVDELLTERLNRFDIHPSGPLWGQGLPRTRGAVQALEIEVSKAWAELARLCESQRLDQERRALRMPVSGFESRFEGTDLWLSFELGRGQFATAVLHELCELQAGSPPEAAED